MEKIEAEIQRLDAKFNSELDTLKEAKRVREVERVYGLKVLKEVECAKLSHLREVCRANGQDPDN